MAALPGGYASVMDYESELTIQRVGGPHEEHPEIAEYSLIHEGYAAYLAYCGHVTMVARGVNAAPRTCGFSDCMLMWNETTDRDLV